MLPTLDRLPRRVRRALHAANIRTLTELLAADRAHLDLSPADARRVAYLVAHATPHVIGAEQPEPPTPAEPAEPAMATPTDLTAGLPALLTTSQVAAFLQMTRRTVAVMCADGRIAGAFKIGDDWRIPRAGVAALLSAFSAEHNTAHP
jgi:excisionase family DNA binding protein